MNAKDAGKNGARVVTAFPIMLLGAVFAAGIAVLAVSLYAVQVRDTAEFRNDQSLQSLRRVQIPGVRGRILDRNGKVLARSRPGVCVACYVDELRRPGPASNTVDAVMSAAASLYSAIGRTGGVRRARVERHLRNTSPMPLVLAESLTDAEQARFAEHAQDFPGMDFMVRDERAYPCGKMAAHVLGYTGRDRPDDPSGAKANYYLPEIRGREGVEKFYDAYLSGVAGEHLIQVDSRGCLRKAWVGRPARPGPDLSLTLDAKLQAAVEKALEGRTGAGVAIDPRNGDVLALASSPAFDPNAFARGIAPDEYAALRDDPGRPLMDRAIAGMYAPGSTFKPVTALAALSSGAVAPGWECDCKGVFRLGAFRLNCWNRWGHGPMDMAGAIAQSCNTYFCEAGRMAGTNAVISAARAFGLGGATGIDLPGEKGGTVPDAAWKMRHLHEPWYPGDLCQMSIGQGFLQTTPLQMAVACAAIANGGAVYRPRLSAPGAGSPRPLWRLPFKAADVARVRAAMRTVAESGTGKRIAVRRHEDGTETRLAVACAGKTGTAEIGRGDRKRKNTWVIAFAPYDRPTVAVALVVENGESGGLTNAPLVHDILAAAFGEVETRRRGAAGGAPGAEAAD